MSLLLDALKTREASAQSSAEPSEEALDGRETLKILTAKMAASSALTLEAGPSDVSTMDTADAPDVAAVPRAATASRNPPIGHAVAAALPSGLPPAVSPARRYAVMLAAAVAVVIVVMVGKSLLHKNSNQISYPDAAESPPAATGQQATRANPSAVQVPTRPASQFSGVGGAPEIDLHEDVVTPATKRAPLRRVRNTIRPDARAVEVGVLIRKMRFFWGLRRANPTLTPRFRILFAISGLQHAKKPLALQMCCEVVFAWRRIGWRLSGKLDRRRQGNADGLEHRAGAARSGGPQTQPPSGLLDVGLHDLIDVADDIGPLVLTAGGGKTVV